MGRVEPLMWTEVEAGGHRYRYAYNDHRFSDGMPGMEVQVSVEVSEPGDFRYCREWRQEWQPITHWVPEDAFALGMWIGENSADEKERIGLLKKLFRRIPTRILREYATRKEEDIERLEWIANAVSEERYG